MKYVYAGLIGLAVGFLCAHGGLNILQFGIILVIIFGLIYAESKL